jgi:alcohol dehydrogenase
MYDTQRSLSEQRFVGGQPYFDHRLPTPHTMTGKALYFTGEQGVVVHDKPIPDPGTGEVLVRTEWSGISPGTELLVYRDEVPEGIIADETIDALDGTVSYPLRYGYSTVGRVAAVGPSVDEDWLDRRVFAFNPHESHFLADPQKLITTTLPPRRALFIPNTEAAVNFVMDARPRVGARVVVFGQGPVWLLTTALLAEFPLSELVTVDCYERRRSLSCSLGADRAVSPGTAGDVVGDPDITFELSGNPAALDEAIDLTGYAGQVIVVSWYGTKDISLGLGGEYHRSHVRMQSNYEGFGIVYLEGMSFGLPTVASRAGGATDIVTDGETGVLIDPDDVAAVAAALTRLADADQLATMGRAARRRYERHPGWEETGARVRDLLIEVASPPEVAP